jgi:ABC-type hemin transport system ATPase subunit
MYAYLGVVSKRTGEQGGTMAKRTIVKAAVVTLRLDQHELEQLDMLTVGQFSRSQILRILVQDFLAKPEKQQKALLMQRLFSEAEGGS